MYAYFILHGYPLEFDQGFVIHCRHRICLAILDKTHAFFVNEGALLRVSSKKRAMIDDNTKSSREDALPPPKKQAHAQVVDMTALNIESNLHDYHVGMFTSYYYYFF